MLLKVIGMMLLAGFILHQGSSEAFGQKRDVYQQNNALVTRQIKSAVLEGEITELLSELAFKYDIPIGLELDTQNPDVTDYRLEVTDGTLPELLDQFVKQTGRYEWFIEKGVVNIYPREQHRDAFLAQILSVRVKSFDVKKGTSCWDLQKLLFETPEIKSVMDLEGIEPAGTNFSGFYIPQLGRDFSIHVSNRKVKEILNQIIKESPVALIWIVSRDKPANTLRLTVNSRHEDLAKEP